MYGAVMRGRAVWVAGACYVLARVLIAAWVGPHGGGDTIGYLGFPVNFVGGQPRPWVVALPMHALGGYGYVIFQAALSAAAFYALAFSIASTIRSERVSVAIVVVVLLLGIAPRTTAWDVMLLSESMAITFTAVLIACLIRIVHLPWWLTATSFALWLLSREAHMYLGLLVGAGLIVWGWMNREWVLPVAAVAVIGWGYATYSNDDTIEQVNVTMNISYHAGSDVEMFRWFVDRGMPPSDAFGIIDQVGRTNELLYVDTEFQAWAAGEGQRVYAEYLATHPSFLLNGPLRALVDESAFNQESLMDHRNDHGLADTPGLSLVWPKRGAAFTAGLFTVAVLLSLWTRRARMIDRRWLLPGLLMASTIPHALLAYHASPQEVARHGTVLAFVLVVSCWWMIALAIDILQASGRDFQPHDVAVHGAAVGGAERGVLALVEPGNTPPR